MVPKRALSISSIIWHPDATVLAITDLFKVWLIDSHNGAVRQHVPISSTGGKGLAWSPDRTWVVTGKTLWTYTNQQLTEVRDLDGPDDEVSVASFSGDSRFVALGTGSRREGKMEPSDTNIYVWQIDTPRRRATFSQHTAIITSIAVNQDATMIVSGDKSGRVYCWAR